MPMRMMKNMTRRKAMDPSRKGTGFLVSAPANATPRLGA